MVSHWNLHKKFGDFAEFPRFSYEFPTDFPIKTLPLWPRHPAGRPARRAGKIPGLSWYSPVLDEKQCENHLNLRHPQTNWQKMGTSPGCRVKKIGISQKLMETAPENGWLTIAKYPTMINDWGAYFWTNPYTVESWDSLDGSNNEGNSTFKGGDVVMKKRDAHDLRTLLLGNPPTKDWDCGSVNQEQIKWPTSKVCLDSMSSGSPWQSSIPLTEISNVCCYDTTKRNTWNPKHHAIYHVSNLSRQTDPIIAPVSKFSRNIVKSIFSRSSSGWIKCE